VLTEEDKKCILMIGGIGIFFQNNLVEASGSVSHGEDIENTLKSSQEMEKEENSVELLKNFNKRDEQEMNAELEPAT
jgi:hypothetical protein